MKPKIEISDLERLFYLFSADSFSESEDKKCFEKEYNEMSLEEQFERGKLTEEEYDKMVELRELKERGLIP